MKILKWVLSALLLVIVLVGVCASQVKSTTELDTSNLLRIHIRANSNEVVDQNVKYKIKDAFVEFLTPLVANCQTKQDAIKMIKQNSTELESLADSVLKKYNFDYKSKVKITRENFPTRVYDQYTVPSGIYDSIIVELGTGTGDNWWCVVYPPLCFTNFNANSSNIVYKSKIMEIINKFFNKE